MANLKDDGDDDGGSVATPIIAALGALAAVWMIGFFYTANTSIKTAPKLAKFIPFL